MSNRCSVILGSLGNACDRFRPADGKDVPPKPEPIRPAAIRESVTGLRNRPALLAGQRRSGHRRLTVQGAAAASTRWMRELLLARSWTFP